MRILAVPALLLLSACVVKPPNIQPTPPPAGAPPQPQCGDTLHEACWHLPPGAASWLYRCPGVARDVAQASECPAAACAVPPQRTVDTIAHTEVTGLTPAMISAVQAAEVQLHEECPELFDAQGRLADKSGAGINHFNWFLAAILARSGAVAGQSIEAGELRDKLYVKRPEPKLWEAYHTVSYGDYGILPPSGGLARGKFWKEPDTEPAPSQPPNPPPVTTPGDLPPRDRLKINTGGTFGKYRDRTPLVTGRPDLCVTYGYTDGRSNCALGPDLSPDRWRRERYIMGEDGGSAAPPNQPGPGVCEAQPAGYQTNPNPDNWMQCWCDPKQHCTATRLCNKTRTVCSDWK